MPARQCGDTAFPSMFLTPVKVGPLSFPPPCGGGNERGQRRPTSAHAFLLQRPLHCRTRHHARVMGGTVFRQWYARSAARPEFHIKQRGVGDRKLACEILLPFELLVDQREPLLGVLAAGR